MQRRIGPGVGRAAGTGVKAGVGAGGSCPVGRAAPEGEGWTRFGDAGIGSQGRLDDAPWLGAWAPGGGEQILADDVGIPLEAGSRVIMQVHYNLLAGTDPDRTAARLRLTSGDADLAPLETMLLPAPVELPCRPRHDDGALCQRAAAVADNEQRFGGAAQIANYLHLLCGTVTSGPVQHCEQTVRRPTTVRAAGGHMHLLGREIRIDVNAGTPQAQTVLDIPVWDFDDQGAKPVKPLHLVPGDTVRVTCRHDQGLRDLLPAFEGQQERYVVWGEGTTDEMCLGMLLVTRPWPGRRPSGTGRDETVTRWADRPHSRSMGTTHHRRPGEGGRTGHL